MGINRMSDFIEFAQSAFWVIAGAIALIVLATFAALIGIRMIGFVRGVAKDIKGSGESDSWRKGKW